ncbi:MAG: hypothetical protein HYT98_05040 [Candidatus Sungbacteria bacterium]|nr:hypothetical protein [Candidatus Sungbacteria bacterium]
MKLEIIIVGTCEICEYRFSSPDVMEVQRKTKECEDKGGNYPFLFKPGEQIKNSSGMFLRTVVRSYYAKETHLPMYSIGFMESSDDASLAFAASDIESDFQTS